MRRGHLPRAAEVVEESSVEDVEEVAEGRKKILFSGLFLRNFFGKSVKRIAEILR